MRIFNGIGEFAAASGTDLGSTDWVVVDQQRVNQFAEATGDHQWIHLDVERAATGPFGGTIVHGLLTLSLLPVFLHELYRVDGVAMAVNYGFNKVRFITPVPVGAKLRARGAIVSVTELDRAVQAVVSAVIEVDGFAKPACVIESVVRYVA